MMVGPRAVNAIQIDELEENPRAVLRRVKERGEVIDVADEGTVVARLMPVETTGDTVALAEWRTRHEEFVKELNRHWPDDVSVEDVMADIRREL